MGRMKDRMMEEEERGWYFVTRKLVCNSCVRDEFLSAFIADHGEATICGSVAGFVGECYGATSPS